ncbi:Peptidase M20 [Penicillium cf. griseofulvum]|uniref:Peptidase M20 n=1 Tax=Penicillium cf. griseofulvum TaxID=2972120 RepID=A0A9W9T697_9EURO|nr:Peptidase M20 [Penicillium cf. griseofulvum]KAJ5422182.1 Peptidase M20 [Penicillium cf. griseofulvum]KAJ5428367.1 Peptidase M20 [Penicillium cf. griseofulvum]
MKTVALLSLAAVPSLALNIPIQQLLFPENPLGGHYNPLLNQPTRETCPQPPKASTPNDGLHSSHTFLSDNAFRALQAERLSRAVQVPTTVGDYMTDPYDEAFEPVVEFQALLAEMFPLVHKHSKIEHINRLGLVFTFEGIGTSRKPLLFMAHQDVVPIDDPSDWTHPPFAGVFDGEWIWGRGSSDCKNVLIGLMSAVEDLLSQDWKPQRTVLFAFGFDEESHGFLGAGAISAALEETYGKDSFEFILDEGGMGLQSLGDDSDPNGEILYALPAVGEKGSIDLIIDIAVPGGHSSIPPAHTGIGIMAEILYELERKELFPAWLDANHPAHGMLECQARYSPDHVETWLSDKLKANDPAALGEAVATSRGPAVRYTMQTSQAIDLIHGGVKSNALPEKISADVNYRVALHQTPDEVLERAIRLIRPIAESHNLTLHVAFPGMAKPTEGDVSDRTLTLSPLSVPLLPAPISPTDPLTSKVWAHFAGVARSVFESHSNPLSKSASGAKPTVVVTGDVMTGNTDTRFYWSLSENIYRWSPSRAGGSLNIHTVDERIRLDVHLEGMMLYYDLIRSFDAWDGESE